ncbi:MAG TPA: hypothetical protein VLI94_13885 [Solirubrobacterales bacterium]|nr:hypothetical protein [Solirubrobacterales bacterium]
MICKLKTLGLAMVAVLAMSAFVASAAQAQYTASSYPTTATAESSLGNDVFTTEGGTVECASHFEGTLNEASTTLTVTPTYTNCKAFGFASATVTMNGCAYVFHRVSKSSSDVTIECPAGKVITIVAGNCEVTIGAQGQLSSISTSNSGSHVNAQANVSGIHYTVTKDGFLCTFTGTGGKTGGTYKQGSAVTLAPTVAGRTISVD